MALFQIYDQLLQFPLFQGMSHDDLEIVAGHTRFGFLKIAAGRTIVKAGDACSQLHFLVNGTVSVESSADDKGYTFIERMSAPYILQQESIFGYYQHYTHTFTAQTDINMLVLDKEEVVRLSEDFLLFRLNLMNVISTRAQKVVRELWRRSPYTLRERIVRFLAQHCVYPAGEKVCKIRMNRLAQELNESRLKISRALNQMEQEGLLVLHRGSIEIPQLEALLRY